MAFTTFALFSSIFLVFVAWNLVQCVDYKEVIEYVADEPEFDLDRQVMGLTGGVVVSLVGTGVFTASCPTNFTLFHCGIGNYDPRTCDGYRYASPISNMTCQCRDNGTRATACVAYCRPVNPAGYQVVSVNITGNGNATCPPGTKVMSCNHRPNINGANFEPYRKFFPSSDGQSCQGYDSVGATLSATCCNARANYTITQANGTGIVYTNCPTGRVLLGCGAKFTNTTANNGKPDPFPATFVVAAPVGCQCKSASGVTCFAMCGN